MAFRSVETEARCGVKRAVREWERDAAHVEQQQTARDARRAKLYLYAAEAAVTLGALAASFWAFLNC